MYLFKILFKDFYRFISNKEGRTFLRLCWQYSTRRKSFALLRRRWRVAGPFAFLWQYHEIFFLKSYHFSTENNHPLIVDCGCNVGLSLAFFNQYYPGAEIYGFEADPNIYEKLVGNMKGHMTNGDLINKAVWIHDRGIGFDQEGTDAGKVDENGEHVIPSIRLKDFIKSKGPIDMLKMDIEGAEHEVIADCEEVLGNVKNIFVELHQTAENSMLSGIIAILERSGFRVLARNEIEVKNPFSLVSGKRFSGQINLYGSRS